MMSSTSWKMVASKLLRSVWVAPSRALSTVLAALSLPAAAAESPAARAALAASLSPRADRASARALRAMPVSPTASSFFTRSPFTAPLR